MERHLETIAAHAGRGDKQPGLAVAPPISLSTTFFLEEPGADDGHAYGRLGNPSRDGLEQTLAALEGGSSALAYASGCAAMHAVLQLLRPGDHLVACADIYGGTYRLIEKLVRPTGVGVSWVDMRNVASVRQAIVPTTKMIWIETPTNPLLRVFDIAALSELAHSSDALVVVDGTFATPALQRPLELGADIVVHSMSKYLNGHSDVVAGAVIARSSEIGERLRFIQAAGGAVLSPFDSYLVSRGLKTLPLRMERHSENALHLAQWLNEQPGVLAVHYPGLPTHPDFGLASSQMDAFGGMVSFEVHNGLDGARALVRRLQVMSVAESLGGVESLVGIPALMSHASMPADVRAARGISDGLVRVSVGLEHIGDLQDDLARALRTP